MEQDNIQVRSVQEISNDTKVRIVNKTGASQDTMVFINDKLVGGVSSIEIGKIDENWGFATAKIEFIGVKLDMVIGKVELKKQQKRMI
jgi:hypothetical protein